MDSSRYYTQASSSHYSNQYQGDGDHDRLSVVPVEQHNVQQYITALYRNPSLLVTPPSNDPAFFAKSQQDMLRAKHKLEQMLLVNQQQAELASIRSAQVPYGHAQNFPSGANTSAQAYSAHQSVAQYYHPAWTDPTQGAWMQSQQGYAQPVQSAPQTYTAHFSPEVEMVDLTQSVQPSPQITQLDAAPQHSLSYHQPASITQAAVPRPPQQRTDSLSSSHQAEPHWSQQPQAPPAATTSYIQNVFHPQPQRVAQAPRHHLQPGQSMSQAGSSGGQRDREQIATTQKQMQYLQQLERQHQRPPAQQQQIAIPQAFPVSLPISLPLTPSAQVTNGASQVQQAPLSSPVSQPTIVEVPVSTDQPPSTPRHNSSQQSNNSASGTDATPTSTPFPKIRTRRPFSLHDLRSERRHSSGRSSSAARPRAGKSGEASFSENAETSEVNGANQVSPSVPDEAQPSSSQRDNIPDNDVSTMSKPPTPEQPPSLSDEMTVPPPEESKPSISLITSSSTSLDTPSTSVDPPPTISTNSAGIVPASSVAQYSASSQAAVPVHSASDPPPASPLPNASAPALNNPVQTQPAMASHASTQPSTAASSSRPKPPAGSGTPMKMALELLHQKGVDCIAIVRQAAQMAGAPVELLEVPSTSTGGGQSPTIPLFAPGQPLDIWTQKLQVTRAQGDAIVKNIWDLAREKARELGLTGLGSKAQMAAAAPNGISGETKDPQSADQPSNSGSSSTPVGSVASVDRAQATSSPKPSTPVALQSSQPATAASTPPAMGTTQSSANPTPVSSHQPTPASKPSTPVPASTQTEPAPVESVPDSANTIAAPTVPAHMDAQPQAVARPSAQSQTQATYHTPSVQELRQTYESLAQRHYYNPFPNGTPPPQPAQPQQQADIPAYVPPNLSSQVQAPVRAPAPAQQATQPKPKNTAAWDYLVSIGVTPDLQPVVGAAKKSKGKAVKADSVATSKTDKGKGKATDMEQTVERQSTSQPVPLPQQSSVDNVAAAPVSAVVEPRAPESLQIPQRPVRPSRPSPAAPEIAVLPEPAETPPSPLSAVDPPQPATPITQEPAEVAAPTPVPASPPVAPILDTPMRSPDYVSVVTPPPEPRLFPSPAPVPSYVQASASPPARSATPPAASTSRSVAPAQPASPAPAASTSALAERSQPAGEHAPLKRKRKPVDASTSSAILPPYYPLPDNTWAAMYAEAANKVAAMYQTSKRPRTTEPTPSTSTSKPLFRPETPTSDDEESEAPPSPKATSSGTNKTKGKRRMIMEVVIPIRKANVKGKAVAVPSAVRSMIDLTLDDRDETEEDSEHQVDDDDSEEEEADLQMLRRRLRPHTCEWVGCIGPPVLASAELLGVHLYKMHLNLQDPKTGYYMCRWDLCRLQFKNTKRLWTHISEAHVARPLYCPYQGCNRTASERHRMIVHVNRSHREDSEAELRPLARPTEFSPEQVVLRPSAFPPGVPYFRIMAMALRYEVLPACISAQRHSRIGPIIQRNISAPSGFVSVPLPGGGNSDRMPVPMPVLDSPVPVRAQVRLETLPPDILGEELEREAGPPPVSPTRSRGRASRAPENISPARSHITVHSDDSTPEPENPTRGSISAGRIRAARGRGRGRGRGQGHEGRSVRSEASSSPSSVRSAPAPGTAPRFHLVVELPSRTRAK